MDKLIIQSEWTFNPKVTVEGNGGNVRKLPDMA